jgi:hypothetical protein
MEGRKRGSEGRKEEEREEECMKCEMRKLSVG